MSDNKAGQHIFYFRLFGRLKSWYGQVPILMPHISSHFHAGMDINTVNFKEPPLFTRDSIWEEAPTF